MALIATSLYTLDRAIRFTRFIFYLPSNHATLTPLPSSKSTRVTLSRSMPNAAAGSHAFLYIPSIRAFQTHPFTMVSRNPIEFVISARDGFTNDLFKAACEKPGRKVRAGIEGAYGCVPDVTGYEKVVLFAGGSGATFAFALAVEWAKKHDVERKGSLELVWSVRTAGKCKDPQLPTMPFSLALTLTTNRHSPTHRFQTRTLRPLRPPPNRPPRAHDKSQTRPLAPITTRNPTRNRPARPNPPPHNRRARSQKRESNHLRRSRDRTRAHPFIRRVWPT